MSKNLPPNRHRRSLLAGGAAGLVATGTSACGFMSSVPGSGVPLLPGASSAANSVPLKAPSALVLSEIAPAPTPPLPPYAVWKNPQHLIVHSANTLETRRDAFGTAIITPAEQLYVRNNLPPPDAAILANRDAWTLQVEGVARPETLTLSRLKAMGFEMVAMVLQCSGNGRGLFPSKPSGTPWTVGAAGCVVWGGVPLRTVAQQLGGVAGRMAFITGTGGEKIPEGLDPKSVIVERSVPIKALGDAMLAWEMNGAPIPLAHGGPLRLVFPGYQGVNHIKYVKRLAFTAQESEARIMSHGYRVTPPGKMADPGQPSVLEMGVKSWVNAPLAETGPLAAGPVMIHGVAFSGGHPLKRIEVSVDGGRTWRKAQFQGPDLGRFAWRQFTLPVQLGRGSYTIASRATDARGNMQSEQRLENLQGYNNTSWSDHAVRVAVV